MKILYRYIIKSFFKPFLFTFLIALFILIMQALWLIFDDLAGKGITLIILLKYVFYVTVMTIPQAIPIAVLLSAIMTLGNLSENYEFAAIKSAGISLQRLLLPLFSIVVLFSFINLYFLNYAFPWAVLKQKNLYSNIKKQKPALALIEGTFNTDIPGYTIKFDKKYGPEENKLKNVLIYQTKGHTGTINTITANNGTITSEEGSKYMNLFLEDGFYYEEHWHRGSKKKERQKMPFSKTHFEHYTVNIDISSFNADNLEDERYNNSRDMLSFKQLSVFSDSLKITFDEYVVNKANTLKERSKANKLFAEVDSMSKQKINMPILSNFDTKKQVQVLESAHNTITRSLDNISSTERQYKRKQKQLNLIDTESHRRIALAFSALLLFLIGAPLGSLIRKGGFGLPMVLAIIIYMGYHFISTFAGNLAETSTIDNRLGGWSSTIIMLPLGIYLSYRATKDKGMLNLNPYIDKIKNFFSKLIK